MMLLAAMQGGRYMQRGTATCDRYSRDSKISRSERLPKSCRLRVNKRAVEISSDQIATQNKTKGARFGDVETFNGHKGNGIIHERWKTGLRLAETQALIKKI